MDFIAVLPINEALDSEADAAADVGILVVRFKYLDSLEIVSPWVKVDPPIRGLHRGFTLLQPLHSISQRVWHYFGHISRTVCCGPLLPQCIPLHTFIFSTQLLVLGARCRSEPSFIC